MEIICLMCKGEKSIWVWDAEYPDDPPRRSTCSYCGARGKIKLTTSETETYRRMNEP